MSSLMFNDEEVHTLVVLPPDGGWGIIVVIASFICHFVIFGGLYSFGVFLKSLHQEFGTEMAETAFVGAFMNGMCYMIGPLVSACLNRYDFRLVSISGCLFAALGYLISSFSLNYWMFLVGQGFLIGIGYGMLLVTALVTPSLYFAKFRTLALSFACCGTGMGTLTVPYVISITIPKFGWRYSYLFMIGIVLIAALASLAFRPLEPKRIVSNKPIVYRGRTFQAHDRMCCAFCLWSNKYFPTAEQVTGKEAHIEKVEEEAFRLKSFSNDSLSSESRGILSKLSLVEAQCNFCWYNSLICLCCGYCETPVRPMYRDDIFFAHSVRLISNKSKEHAREMQDRMERNRRRSTASKLHLEKIKKSAENKKKLYQNQASTSQVSDNKKSRHDDYEELMYNMTVTHITTDEELYGSIQTKCCVCHVAGMRALTTLLDCRIMKSIAFLLLALNGFFFNLGYTIPILFVHERAMENGIPRNEAIAYISMIGIANVVGRLLIGFFSLIVNINCVWVTIVSLLAEGVVTLCSGICMLSWAQIIFVCSYGLLAGPFNSLRTIVVVEIFGLENLTNIFGLQLVFSGIACILGPTIAGYLRDYSYNYTYSFYFSGACLTLSGILLSFIKPVRDWEIRTELVDF